MKTMGMDTDSQSSVASASASKFAGQRVHLIGIGGCGMRAIAEILLVQHAHVSGSEMSGSSATEKLSDRGAIVAVGQRAENIPADCDLVVYSAAIHDQNPELVEARRRGVKILKYSQMLGELMDEKVGVAIAGTHGKSTTTAMIAFALAQADFDPSFVVGATVEQLGGPSGVGAGKHFVAEACEFDRSFLNLHPHLSAILNIEEDHLDCYHDLSAIIEAFRAFVGRVKPGGVLIVNGEDRNVAAAVRSATCEVQTFGLTEKCTWRAANVTTERGRYHFNILYKEKKFCKVAMSLPGLHNLYNALAAAAILHHAGVENEKIGKLVGLFSGTKRRMTLKAQIGGITIVDDYAHHPTEIQVTLKAIREYYQPERMICVFQPHQHSRTRFLLKDFARSFAAADEVIVPDIYFVRDSALEKDHISSQDLVAQIRLHGGSAMYLERFEDINTYLQGRLTPGDLVVTMGAGNIWEVADELIHWIGRNR